MTDFVVENEGSIYLVRPMTVQAEAWIRTQVAEDAQYFGSALVVEHRYVADVVKGMLEDGLTMGKEIR